MLEAPPNNRVSLENKEWLILLIPFEIYRLVMVLSLLFLYSALLRVSTIMMYRKGDSGNPCLIPLELWKKSLGLPFISGAIHGSMIEALMTSITSIENPNFFRTTIRYGRLNLSKALAMSNFIIIAFSFLSMLE